MGDMSWNLGGTSGGAYGWRKTYRDDDIWKLISTGKGGFEIVETKIYFHKYVFKAPSGKLGKVLKLYHSGIEIDNVEYWFSAKDRVESTENTGHPFDGAEQFDVETRSVNKDLQEVLRIFNQVRDRWNGTKYHLFEHNCNFFADDVLTSLGLEGVGHEMLDSGDLRMFVTYIPGVTTVAELFKLLDGTAPDGLMVLSDLLGVNSTINIATDIINNPHVKDIGDKIGDGIRSVFRW